MKDNAEAYPYVWASYIVVYGGFGLWVLAYRWRKLRKTEGRVRVLQERPRTLVEAVESASTIEKATHCPQVPGRQLHGDHVSIDGDSAPKVKTRVRLAKWRFWLHDHRRMLVTPAKSWPPWLQLKPTRLQPECPTQEECSISRHS